MSTVPSVTRGLGRLVAITVAAVLLLAGCQAVPEEELEGELVGISGVALADVGTASVKVTLADDIAAADASAAIVAARDVVVASHPLGAEVEFVVVLPAGERDLGLAQPWQVYSYASWSAGAVTDAAFEQQSTFFASLADWETLVTGPAQFLHLGFRVAGVSAPEPTETEAPAEGEAPVEEEAPEDGEAAALSPQVITVVLRAPSAAENVATDVAAVEAELATLWTTSGGDAAALTIS